MEDDIDHYGEYGCCLTCDPEWKEDHQTEPDEEDNSIGYCLCTICKCKVCFWYEPTFSGEWYPEERIGGRCTHPSKSTFISKDKLSNKKIRNAVKETNKAVLAEIEGLSGLRWIPLSVIKDGYVKEWFYRKEKKK